MFCTKCGAAVSSSDDFCASCGASLSSSRLPPIIAQPQQANTQNVSSNPHSAPGSKLGEPRASILVLVIARFAFAVGFLVLLYLSGAGVIPSSYIIYVILGYVLFCELLVARTIKSHMATPMTASQRSLALAPWLLIIVAIAFAFLLPLFRG